MSGKSAREVIERTIDPGAWSPAVIHLSGGKATVAQRIARNHADAILAALSAAGFKIIEQEVKVIAGSPSCSHRTLAWRDLTSGSGWYCTYCNAGPTLSPMLASSAGEA